MDSLNRRSSYAITRSTRSESHAIVPPLLLFAMPNPDPFLIVLDFLSHTCLVLVSYRLRTSLLAVILVPSLSPLALALFVDVFVLAPPRHCLSLSFPLRVNAACVCPPTGTPFYYTSSQALNASYHFISYSLLSFHGVLLCCPHSELRYHDLFMSLLIILQLCFS